MNSLENPLRVNSFIVMCVFGSAPKTLSFASEIWIADSLKPIVSLNKAERSSLTTGVFKSTTTSVPPAKSISRLKPKEKKQTIPINIITVSLVSILGIPGMIGLILFSLF